MKQAVILAGGKGTRLADRLGGLPKPLIDFCGVPLLERQILLLKKYEFTSILILVNYRAEAIVEFCTLKANWGLDVQCIDDGEPRGTAGAVLGILDRLDDEFIVMYGDTMLQVDLDRFQKFHRCEQGVSATLFLHPNDHPHDSDLVEINEVGDVKKFHPYPHPEGVWLPNLVNAALYWVKRDALLMWRDDKRMLDFGRDIFPAMIEQGMRLRGYNSPEYIKDIGTPSRIDKVSTDFRSGRIDRAGLDYPQAAVFLDRDGTLNFEVNHLRNATDFELLPGVENAIQALNKAEYRVCVVTNQPVIARGDCSVDELANIHNKMETLLGRAGAYVDRIDYCPHHPDSGFAGEVAQLKIDCNCRKPNTGMVDSAILALNIAREKSWMIGDSSSDILAAKRAGLRSILVETGYAGLDHKYLSTPDYVVANLPKAVDFILRGHPLLLRALESIAKSIAVGDIVFIGGQSRGGKSTTASGLRELLQRVGHTCHVLSTDRWLMSQTKRSDGVAGRHDMEAINHLIKNLSGNRRDIVASLPGYAKGHREQTQNLESLRIAKRDTVIVEGVIALSVSADLKGAHRMVVTTDEQVRRSRVIREYGLRGEQDQAEAIYAARMQDEYPWVEVSAKGAMRFEVTNDY
jgi:histidinol-phosphate phosphatase family protein